MVDYRLIKTDVLVIGGGGAGCRAAMAAADSGARVLLMEKGRLGVTGSTFDPFTHGKGIIVAVEGYNPTDDPEVHVREAMAVARGMARPALVRAVAYDTPDRFRELLDIGLRFLPSRVGSCFGETMRGTVIDQPSLARAFKREIGAREVQVMEKTMVTGLLTDGQRCTGAVAVTHRGEVMACRARAVILATGGASSMFRYHFNAPGLTGDGYAMALRAGAELTNLEYYQSILGTTQPARVFLPQWYLAGNPSFYNAEGRHFLPDYAPEGVDPGKLMVERSFHGPFSSSRPSGWVDIAIHSELQAGRGTAPWDDERRLAGTYCDFASLPAEVRRELDGRFLPALGWLKARGLDFEARPIPVAPFAHAFNGGIVIDENGATGVPGLYACGEVAAGPHGANRLGGHMFAVLLVFGKRAGEAAARSAAESPPPVLERDNLHRQVERIQALRSGTGRVRPHNLRRAIQRTMSPIMITKDAARLETALAALDETRQAIVKQVGLRAQPDLFEAMGVANLLEIAALLARAATLRCESRGPHYRTDYPEERDRLYAGNLVWKLEGDAAASRWAALG
jgi:succinate dehydrogenase/fumarate reductase flavoprotein subunit